MARCDFAQWRELPDNQAQPTMRATQVIMHSMAIPGATPQDLIRRWSQPGTPLESHFIVGRDGRAYQLTDTARSADANYHANRRPDGTGAISIETEDNIGPPDTLPWTDAQLATLVRLALWAAQVHGVPRRRCRTPSDPGQGYHTLFGAPSEWTPVAKTCPGRIRIQQWNQIVLPAIEAGQVPEEDDMKVEEFLDALEHPRAKTAIGDAVADALAPFLQRPSPSGLLFVKQPDRPAVYAVTAGQLFHVMDQTHFNALSGGKPISATVLEIPAGSPVWQLPINGEPPA